MFGFLAISNKRYPCFCQNACSMLLLIPQTIMVNEYRIRHVWSGKLTICRWTLYSFQLFLPKPPLYHPRIVAHEVDGYWWILLIVLETLSLVIRFALEVLVNHFHSCSCRSVWKKGFLQKGFSIPHAFETSSILKAAAQKILAVCAVSDLFRKLVKWIILLSPCCQLWAQCSLFSWVCHKHLSFICGS